MKSMTGFGEGEASGPQGRCVVQIQSVNGKYFKLLVNLQREIAPLEPRVRGYLQKRIKRGQVSASMTYTPPGGSLERMTLDRRSCKELAEQFRKVRSWLGLEGNIDLMTLVTTGAVMRKETVGLPRRAIWAVLRKALASACDGLSKSQEREGWVITRDFIKRWRRVDSLIGRIDRLRNRSARKYEEKIRRRVRTVLHGAHYDENRLLAEVSIFADRVDVSEEIVRLRSHMKHFRQLMLSGAEVGKKLDFVTQEIMREVNTCANKANDALISRLAIEVKAEMEKMREQLQNVQ